MAARELLSRGYRRIGFMGGPESATSTQDRLQGFMTECQAHTSRGLKISHSFAAAYSFEAGLSEMTRLLRRQPAQAYFCGDDILSIGALAAIQKKGLSVPDDIGLIGLNDMAMSGWENIALTTIRQPIEQIVSSSIELIVAMLKEPDRYPEARLFPATIIERDTLRPHSDNTKSST